MTAQLSMRGDVAVLVPAAGLGTRLGPGTPKALRELGGASLLAHAVRRLSRAPSVAHVVVAVPPDHLVALAAALPAELPPDVSLQVVVGGASRQASVAAALAVVPERFAYVLVHDAARAFAPADLVERVAAALRVGHRAVIPVLDVVDTVKQVDGSGHVVATLDRSQLRTVQTPQGFHRAVLEAGHRAVQAASAVDGALVHGGPTDDAGLAELLGVKVFCVPGSAAALKITRPADLELAEAMLRRDHWYPTVSPRAGGSSGLMADSPGASGSSGLAADSPGAIGSSGLMAGSPGASGSSGPAADSDSS